MLRIKFTVYGQPVTKKNHQQIFTNRTTGKPFITQSKQYKKFEEDSIIQIPKEAKLGINVPCSVTTVYYLKDDRRCDLGNLISASHDILVRAGVIEDDNRKILAIINAWAETDKANPRTEYTIEILR